MITESNPLKLEYVIIIFLLIIATVLLFYKSVEPEKTNNKPKIEPKSILKKLRNIYNKTKQSIKNPRNH